MKEKENNTLRERNNARLERIANVATRWIGSTASILVHTFVFLLAFALPLLNLVSFDKMLLVLTTIVSLEAIYLAIFIQMSVNKNSEDIEEIQEDVEEIQEDIEEIQENVDEIQEDVEEIQEDVEEIQEDVEEIQEEFEELQEELDENSGETKQVPVPENQPVILSQSDKLSQIQQLILQLQKEVEQLKADAN